MWHLYTQCSNGSGWKREKKNISFSFLNRFCYPVLQQAMRVLSHSIWFTNTNSTHTYLCLLSAALRQGIRSRRQEYWFSARKRLRLKGISHNSSNPFLWRLRIQEGFAFLANNSLFLYSICELVLVFLPTSFSFFSCSVPALSRNRSTLLLLQSYSWRFIVCCWLFIRAWSPALR